MNRLMNAANIRGKNSLPHIISGNTEYLEPPNDAVVSSVFLAHSRKVDLTSYHRLLSLSFDNRQQATIKRIRCLADRE